MALKSDAKFEEKRTLGSQNDKKLGEFYDVSSGKSGNVNFDKLPLQKVCNVLAKKKSRACVVKNDLWFQK